MSNEASPLAGDPTRQRSDATPPHADMRVVRRAKVPALLDLGRTATAKLFEAGELTAFPLTSGGRAKAVFVRDIEAYLTRRAEQAKR